MNEMTASKMQYSRLLWSSTGMTLVGSTKVKSYKSLLFNEGSLKVENKEHSVDFVVSHYFAAFKRNNKLKQDIRKLA